MNESNVTKELTVENEEDCLARHRKEKKDLQVEIQRLKHSVSKGDKKKKKEINAQIAVLDAELDRKHEQEIQELRSKLTAVHVTEDLNNDVAETDDCIANDSSDKSEKKQSKSQRRKDKKAQKEQEREERIRHQEILNETGVRHVETEKIKALLKARGLYILEVPSDGNCLYAAIADQLRQRQIEASVESLRRQAAEYMRQHVEEFLPFLVKEGTGDMYTEDEYMAYCQKVESTSEWGGHTEIRALSDILASPIEIIQADGANIVVGERLPGIHIVVSYHRHAYGLGEHYNSVCPTPPEEESNGFS